MPIYLEDVIIYANLIPIPQFWGSNSSYFSQTGHSIIQWSESECQQAELKGEGLSGERNRIWIWLVNIKLFQPGSKLLSIILKKISNCNQEIKQATAWWVNFKESEREKMEIFFYLKHNLH